MGKIDPILSDDLFFVRDRSNSREGKDLFLTFFLKKIARIIREYKIVRGQGNYKRLFDYNWASLCNAWAKFRLRLGKVFCELRQIF